MPKTHDNTPSLLTKRSRKSSAGSQGVAKKKRKLNDPNTPNLLNSGSLDENTVMESEQERTSQGEMMLDEMGEVEMMLEEIDKEENDDMSDDKNKYTRKLSSRELWEKEAKKLHEGNHDLENIDIKKIALILMVYRQGIFNALGQGGNPRYIRSDENAVIKLTVGRLTQDKNKKGEIPDIYQEITPKEWRAVVKVLGKSTAASVNTEDEKQKKLNLEQPQELISGQSISKYIENQRSISHKIKQAVSPKISEIKLRVGNKDFALMELIFDNNYPALNIHFPALLHYIKNNQEIKGKKNKVGAAQAKGMTKFLMARLINLYNTHKNQAPELVEKSSFGFQTPTLGDLGVNMSIRLSPGIDDKIIKPMGKALQALCEELKALMEDKETQSIGHNVTDSNSIYHYWQSSTENPSPADMLQSYNTKKTKLNHLLFTQVEKGKKGHTIVGRTLERNHNNLLHLARENMSLKDWAGIILGLHTVDELEKSLDKKTLNAPQLLKNNDLDNSIASYTGNDNVAEQRLLLFKAIATKLEDDKKQDKWDEEASDSEYEDEDISTGKAVLPSGMASLSQLLGSKVNQEEKQVKKKMISGLYYEDYDHAEKSFNLAGYTAKDVVIADLNPNIATSQESQEGATVKNVLKQLETAKAKVWIVDLTSATLNGQKTLVDRWKINKTAELLITIVSGLKHQELGLNSNPHGLTHWMYKKDKDKDKDKLEKIKKHFTNMRKKPVNRRSKISNEMRRYHKKLGSYSWARLGYKKLDK